MADLPNKSKALSNLSFNIKADNQTKKQQQQQQKKKTDLEWVYFFVVIICSKILKFNSCKTTDVDRNKKTTHNSQVTRQKNQQIKFLNNWTEQKCLLLVTHHEINLPLPLHNPKYTYRNDFY